MKTKILCVFAAIFLAIGGIAVRSGGDGIHQLTCLAYLAVAALLLVKAVIRVLPNRLLGIVLGVLSFVTLVTLFPIGRNFGLMGMQPWWDERIFRYLGANEEVWTVEKLLMNFGIGGMNWLHIDFISALAGVVALGLLAFCLMFSERISESRSVINFILIVLLVISQDIFLLFGLYLMFCIAMQEE